MRSRYEYYFSLHNHGRFSGSELLPAFGKRKYGVLIGIFIFPDFERSVLMVALPVFVVDSFAAESPTGPVVDITVSIALDFSFFPLFVADAIAAESSTGPVVDITNFSLFPDFESKTPPWFDFPALDVFSESSTTRQKSFDAFSIASFTLMICEDDFW